MNKYKVGDCLYNTYNKGIRIITKVNDNNYYYTYAVLGITEENVAVSIEFENRVEIINSKLLSYTIYKVLYLGNT